MASNPSTPSNSGHHIPEHILDDLCSRFIINIPEEERNNMIRIFFQIENAHWFYLDFYCKDNADLRPLGIKEFSTQIFRHCPTLVQHADNVEKIHGSWKEYKLAVPTNGAILLDPTLQFCLLVQGFWSKTSWGFPKGKVNEGEAFDQCAIREVYEETGFDTTPLLDKEEYIDYKMHGQSARLYLVPGVSRETKFAPRTRNEIKKVEWFRIEHLPTSKKDTGCKERLGLPPNAFFMVMPFVRSLKQWINKRLGRPDTHSRESSHTPKVKDSSKEGKIVSDKKRAKQQEKFQQQNQQNFLDSIKCKDAQPGKSTKGRQHAQGSPTFNHKTRNQASSPGQNRTKQAVQILKRDGTVSSGSTKKSLAPMFEDKNNVEDSFKSFMPESWKNFKLDANAVLASFYGKNPQVRTS